MHPTAFHSEGNGSVTRFHCACSSCTFWCLLHYVPPIKDSIPIVEDIRAELLNFLSLFFLFQLTFICIQEKDKLVFFFSLYCFAKRRDRKSTRLNSSHVSISYAV